MTEIPSAAEILVALDVLRDRRKRGTITEADYRTNYDQLWADLVERDLAWLKSTAKKRKPGLLKLLHSSNDLWELTHIGLWLDGIAEAERLAAKKTKYNKMIRLFVKRMSLVNSLDDPRLVTKPFWMAKEDFASMTEERIEQLCVTVAAMAKKLAVSQTTVRRYLDSMGITFYHMSLYSYGSGRYRKDVTAYFYRPETTELIVAEMDRRDSEYLREKKTRLERKEIEEQNRRYERETGFSR